MLTKEWALCLTSLSLSIKISLINTNAMILESIWQSNKIGSKRHPSNNRIPPHKKRVDDINRS